LELWQPAGNHAEEPISTTMGLSREAIVAQLLEHQQADRTLILLVDSPFGIVVCDTAILKKRREENIPDSAS
jgi:hypothetical protein